MSILSKVAQYVSEKISVSDLRVEDYISTDNMLKDKGGIEVCVEKPNANKVTKYRLNDILVSNIRPYFKKIWFSNKMGGCSNDVIVFRVLDEEVTVPKFLYYLLSQNKFFDYVMSGSNGTKMPRGNKKLILNFQFAEFKIETQQKIASILSAYDDLIQNNQKQIKLLEEAAQRLYKEWFVALHFPVYEDVAITDGVPDGWKKGNLIEVAEFKRGKTITKATIKEGNVPVVAGGLEPAYYHNTSNTQSPVITISSSGANAGFTRMYYTKIWASDCSFIDIENTQYFFFTYCYLKANKKSLDNLQKGAAQPHVYAKDVNTLELLIPPDTLLEQFCLMVSRHFKNIGNLERQNQLLSQARDRLLPKLMSGEIEV